MTTTVAALITAVVLSVASVPLWRLMLAWLDRRRVRPTGQPTPESARIIVEAKEAKDKIDAAGAEHAASLKGKTNAELLEEYELGRPRSDN